jgi:elongation factor Ts
MSIVITAEMVRVLREKSGAAMMDCKKALTENGGDVEASMKWLREQGIASAEKKAGRAAAEGLAGFKIDGKKGVIVEINCETDFVAKTEKFLALVDTAVHTAHKAELPADPIKAGQVLAAVASADGQTLEHHVKTTIGTLGENMALARVMTINVKQGVLGSYRHSDGKLVALVALECGKAETAAKPEVIELAKDLAMQVAGKPQAIIDKIAEGKVNKVLQENTLLEQAFIKDTNVKIADLLKQAGAKVGDTLTVGGFIRLKVGVK